MKRWSGSSSESVKCAYCNKITSDYETFEEKGIHVKVWSHYECRENNISMDAKNSINIMKSAVVRFKR